MANDDVASQMPERRRLGGFYGFDFDIGFDFTLVSRWAHVQFTLRA